MASSRQRNQREPTPESLLRIVERGDLLDDTDVQHLVSVATVTDSTSLRRRIEKLLMGKALQRQVQPFDADGVQVTQLDDRLTLGTTLTGSHYDLLQEDLTQHLLAVGQSGAGKTTLFYNLMEQVTVPFWAFDVKRDYRHFLDRDTRDLLVLPWTEFKFNPLQPPSGVSPRRWAQVFSEIFGHATALLSGSKNYLMQAVIDLYQLYDIFEEVSAPYPSMHELRLLAERDKINYVRTSSDYRDRILNRLDAMTLTAGTIFDCSEGYPIEDLLQRNVVFEFDGLSTDLQNFLMEILFAYVYEYRVAQNHRGGNLRHVFFLDEGKQVFSVYKERQDAAGIPAIDKLTAKMREFGEGLIVADQEASKLTDSIKANTYTKLLLATGDAKQFQDIAASMHLTERQRDLAQQLDVGEAVVQTGNGEPIPVKLDTYELEKTVSDDDVRQHQRETWNQLACEPRETTAAFDRAVAGTETDGNEIPDDPAPEINLSDQAIQLLKDVVEHPFKPLTDRYELLANAYQGNKAKTELVENNIVVERTVRTGSEKRKLLDITERGRDYLDTQGIDLDWKGRGGIVHQFWQHRVKELFEAVGWTVKRELFDADVYVNMNETELVVEIAMENAQREVEHVKQHLDAGFDNVWVVCRNEKVRDGLQERLAEKDVSTDCIAFRLFRDISNTECLQIE